VIDTGNLVDGEFDRKQDDENRDTEIRGEDVIGRMERDPRGGAIGQSQGDSACTAIGSQGIPDTLGSLVAAEKQSTIRISFDWRGAVASDLFAGLTTGRTVAMIRSNHHTIIQIAGT
jgi:hypothetical protein